MICVLPYVTHTHTHTQSPTSLYYLLGVNPKVRLSVQTMFSLAHHYGNILREGWKNLLDCLLTLFKTKVLPEVLIEVSSESCDCHVTVMYAINYVSLLY